MAIRAEFEVPQDCMILTTQTNGDRIEIKRVHLGVEAASNLATLINTPNTTLMVIIKKKGEV